MTSPTKSDIKDTLAIADADEFVASFNRENLFLAVEPKTDGLAQTLAFLEAHAGESGIIYCATRSQVDTLTGELAARGWPVLPYHAGLDDKTRRQNQRLFRRDETCIMVATIAFGMGIDKSNVRFILHYDLTKNPESYYQQIGRAGRDGLRADCLLLFSPGDLSTINFFINQRDPGQRQGARWRRDAMVDFCESNLCRRRPLLAYFDEPYDAERCDMCDNCLAEDRELVDLTVPAQKFLSCVKRTGEIFGASHVIDVLRGSRSKRVVSRGHHRLSTHNIGRELSRKEWQFLARQFIQQGLITQDEEHGSLRLTSGAYDVFKGRPVMGVLPESPTRATYAQSQGTHDPELFELLRDKRKMLAEDRNLPPYVVFSDRSLAEMATYYPQSRPAFATVYGVGEAKLAKYAGEFLPIIRDYCAARGISEKRKSVPAVQQKTGTRTEEVAQAFNAGSPVPEIAERFGVKNRTVLNHLWKAARAGTALRRSDLLELSTLPAGDQQRALESFAELGPDFLRPVYEALGESVSYDELHLLRLHFVSGGT